MVTCAMTLVACSQNTPAETSVLLAFTATNAQDYVYTGDSSVAVVNAEDPALTLTVGTRYKVMNDVRTLHPFEFITRGADASTDVVLLSELSDGLAFESDPDVNFVVDESGFSFTLTAQLAAQLDGYRCAFHPASMRAPILINP